MQAFADRAAISETMQTGYVDVYLMNVRLYTLMGHWTLFVCVALQRPAMYFALSFLDDNNWHHSARA